eukprot:scaffold1736_cov127-Cylindrotheca_fusiformis.AAC.2
MSFERHLQRFFDMTILKLKCNSSKHEQQQAMKLHYPQRCLYLTFCSVCFHSIPIVDTEAVELSTHP